MASHHHYHHHHQINALPTCTAAAAAYCCCGHCCIPSYSPSPPPTTQTDTLLQALASLLLQQQQQQQPPPNKPHHFYHHKNQNFKHQKAYFHQQRQEQLPKDPHFILSSLLHRIDALESSLQHFSSSTCSHCPSYSLRDAAARVIQTHFRAFLVRRSRTLWQLKQLALIKSSFNSLKLSVSKNAHFNFDSLSSKAMDLLIKLDSIQGGDPMIRDGKRSISRDLVSFLEFIDGFAVKRHEVSYRAAKNVRFVGKGNNARVLRSNCGDLGGDEREVIEKLRDKVHKIRGFPKVVDNDEKIVELQGFHQVIDDDEEQNPFVSVSGKGVVSNTANGILVKKNGGLGRVKKSVSFAKNGKVYRIFDDTHDPVLVRGNALIDGSDSSEDQAEEEKLSNEIEDHEDESNESEDDEEAHLEDGGSPQNSDAERNPRSLRGEARFEVSGDSQGQNGNLVFTAPLPVKMESRDDLVKKRKALKILS